MINDNSSTAELGMTDVSALRLMLKIALDELEKADARVEALAEHAHVIISLLAQKARLRKQEREAERQPQQLEVRTVSLEEILNGFKAKIAAQHGIPL